MSRQCPRDGLPYALDTVLYETSAQLYGPAQALERWRCPNGHAWPPPAVEPPRAPAAHRAPAKPCAVCGRMMPQRGHGNARKFCRPRCVAWAHVQRMQAAAAGRPYHLESEPWYKGPCRPTDTPDPVSPVVPPPTDAPLMRDWLDGWTRVHYGSPT